jgi:hypothetical protein
MTQPCFSEARSAGGREVEDMSLAGVNCYEEEEDFSRRDTNCSEAGA